MFTPPVKAARTERHTVSNTTITAVTSTTTVTGATAMAASSHQHTSAHFNTKRAGTSTRTFVSAATANSVAHSNLPLCGMGSEISWIYAPGSKHIAAWSTLSGKKILGASAAAHGIAPVPVLKANQGEIAFIAECELVAAAAADANPIDAKKGLVYCSSLGTVVSADRSIAFNFEFEAEDGTTTPFDVCSFATAASNDQIAAPMFHNTIAPTQHVLAGTTDGYLLCAVKKEGGAAAAHQNKKNKSAASSSSADAAYEVLFCNVALAEAECAPAIAADLDVVGNGQYLLQRASTRVPAAAMDADAASNATSKASQSSWWKSWIPTALRNQQQHQQQNGYAGLNDDTFADNDDEGSTVAGVSSPVMDLGATGSSKALAKLRNKRIEHIKAAKNGIVFTVGGSAVAFATKVAEASSHADDETNDADGSVAQNGLKLVWSCPIAAILSPKRPATVAALSAVDGKIFALVLFDDDISSGFVVSLSAYNGSIVTSRSVQLSEEALTAAMTAPTAASDSANLPRIDLLVATPAAGSPATVSVVVGNTITHFSLQGASAHNPCASTDVEALSEDVLAAGVTANGQLYVLTNDGPFSSAEASELDAARARQQISGLLDTIRVAEEESQSAANTTAAAEGKKNSGSNFSADAIILAASDAILYSAETHSDNWARVQDNASAREDLNALTFVTAQLHQRQLKHRTFVQTVLNCEEIVEKISLETIARLISDQEKLLALRYIRELQNADPRDGLHEMMQRHIRNGVVAVAAMNRSTTRLQGHRASNAEIFFADHNSVVDLVAWANAEIKVISQSANFSHPAAKVDAAIALGNLCPRVLEATYESRNTLPITGNLLPLMWTGLSHSHSSSASSGEAHNGCNLLVQQLAGALSDVLDFSVRFNATLSATHNADIGYSAVISGANSPISLEAQQSLLSLVDSLLQHTLTLASASHKRLVESSSSGNYQSSAASVVTALSAEDEEAFGSLLGSPTFDYAAYIAANNSFAEALLRRTLLRQPFLVPAHVSPSTGDIHMFGYPYGAPKPNPQCLQLSSLILRIAEAFAMKFKIYSVLYAFALSDPNAIDCFTDQIDAITAAEENNASAIAAAMANSPASGTQSPTAADSIAAAAARFYGKYQEYCRTVDGFYVASLHLMLMDPNFQREHEVCHSAKFCGLDRKAHRPSLVRNLFLKYFAPQLLWVAVPEFVDYIAVPNPDAAADEDEDEANVDYVPNAPVGGEASLALLREGLSFAEANLPAGDDALAHRSSCASLARLCWFAHKSAHEGEEDDEKSDDAVSHDPSTVPARAQHKQFGADVPCKINTELAVVGFQSQFFGATHASSILAAPELVKLLLSLPDNVDAWRAAAVVCDAIGYAHGGCFDSDAAEGCGDDAAVAIASSSSVSPSPEATMKAESSVDLIRLVYAAALRADGPNAITSIVETAASESEAAKLIAATAQGRIILASHSLSGLPQPPVAAACPCGGNPSSAGAAALPQITAQNWSVALNAAMSATASPIINHRYTTVHASRNNLKGLLTPVLSSSSNGDDAAKKTLKVLSDWLAQYAQKGGALVAPSPAAVVINYAGGEAEAIMPQAPRAE